MKFDKKGFALLLEWAEKDRRYLYASIVFSLFSSLSTIVPYFAFYQIIDSVVLGTCNPAFALKWAFIVLVTTAVRVCCNLAASLASHRGAYNTLFRVRCMVTEYMAKMPLGALNERSTGEIKYVMDESIEKLELFLAHNLPELVLYLSGPIAMFFYLLTVNWILALLSIVPLFLAVAVMVIMFQRFGKFMSEVNASSANLSGSIHEYVSGMRLIKAYHKELSEILGISMDTVLAQMAYLERLGLLRRISIGGDCAGVCKNCSSACKPQWSHPFVMWEKPVKSNP